MLSLQQQGWVLERAAWMLGSSLCSITSCEELTKYMWYLNFYTTLIVIPRRLNLLWTTAGYQGLEPHPSVCLRMLLVFIAFDLSDVLLSPAIILPFTFSFLDSFSKQVLLDLFCTEMHHLAQCGGQCESAAFGNTASW